MKGFRAEASFDGASTRKDGSVGLRYGESPSKRLRSVLYVYWKEVGRQKNPDVDFDTFYMAEMEKIRTNYLNKVDENG